MTLESTIVEAMENNAAVRQIANRLLPDTVKRLRELIRQSITLQNEVAEIVASEAGRLAATRDEEEELRALLMQLNFLWTQDEAKRVVAEETPANDNEN